MKLDKIDKAYIGFQIILCTVMILGLITIYIRSRIDVKKINEKYDLIFQEK